MAWDHLPALNAGLVFDRDEAAVQAVLRRAQALDEADWLRMSQAGRRHVQQQLDPVKLAERVWQAMTAAVPVDEAKVLAEEPK